MGHARRTITILTAAVTAAISLAGVSSANAAPTASATDAANASQKVIVVLRDQLASTPASKKNMAPRRARATSSQDAVLRRLSGARPAHVTHFALGNAFAATVTAAQAAASRRTRRWRRSSRTARSPSPRRPRPLDHYQGVSDDAAPSTDGPDAVCPSDPSKPLVEPEALRSIRALTTDGTPNAQQLATGAGVKVAFIADSLDPNNPDFIRPDGQHVFVDYQDFSGAGPTAPSDGREAFGDASSIAAQGTVVHDLSQVRQPGPPAAARLQHPGRRRGAGRQPGWAGLRQQLLDPPGDRLRGEHRPRRRPERVVRSERLPRHQHAQRADAVQRRRGRRRRHGDRLQRRRRHHQHDRQPARPEGHPGRRHDRQPSVRADELRRGEDFGSGPWVDDNISALSSSGLTQYARTVDIAAPGEANWAVCEPGYSGCVNFRGAPSDLQSFGGTSESAPLTAGVAALVIQAYRSTHGGSSPTPALVKQFITGTAHDLGLPADEQGAGLLDARAAVEAALS